MGTEGKRRAKRRKRKSPVAALLLIIFMALIVVAGGFIWLIRYAPTTEHGSLSSYYTQTREDEVCVVLNGSYLEPTEEEAPYGLAVNGNIYLEYTFVKQYLDDGYVYDSTEGVLRYATDTSLITVLMGHSDFTVDGDEGQASAQILWQDGDQVYILADFLKNYTDVNFYAKSEPNRIIMESAGYIKTEAKLRRNAAVRRFGGPKSLILEDGIQGESVTILEDYGKWICVLTENGTIGCVMDRQVKDKQEKVVEARLPKRVYSHKQMDGNVKLGWHQVTNASANSRLDEALANNPGLNVISPTWFQLNDNNGNINNLSSGDYVASCHARGLQVWALVSNIEVKVDEESVLNVTSHRDNLVNNLVNACLASGIDGINVDFEALSIGCKNGYIQFIRELSLACKKNNLFLSVDNYPPADHNLFYNRKVQADYADYVILMAYDEHNATTDPGSTASLSFVKEAVANTLTEVPAEQLVMACPLYTRIWTVGSDGIGCRAQAMKATPEYLAENGATTTWLTDEGQNYAEFVQDGVKVQIWVEDDASMAEKLKIYQQNKLAGVAFWKLGFDTPQIWGTVSQYVN